MKLRRPLLLPFVPLYAAGLAWKNRRFDRNSSHSRHLGMPVISVGSLSAGGAGKTPFLIALVELLRSEGFGIDVLSRGYGRTGVDTLHVNSLGDAALYGDEPLLLARRLACPVYVGRERFDAGRMAEADLSFTRGDRGMHVHLLDDGFQHRQLLRAVDIVLLTVQDVQDSLLPAGNLREPLSALRRANVIVLRAEEADALRPVLERVLTSSSNARKPHLWIIQRQFAFVTGALSGNGAAPAKPLAFCGIARPEEFASCLRRSGVEPAALITFRDHHRYTEADVLRLVAKARASGADSFLTTTKDEVKLSSSMRLVLQQVGPLAIADVRVILDEPAIVMQHMRELLASAKA